MGKNTEIQWCDATWNPWMGCTKISEGCKNCYMFRDQKRFGKDPTEIRRSKTTLNDPLKWKEPRRIFVCSWSDFFHEDVPDEWRRATWEIMYHMKEHTFLILTKRPENISDMLPAGWIEGMWKYMRNVWFGVSVENQKRATERIPKLLQTPAAVHFVSAEPLLSPIEFDGWLKDFDERQNFINWVITGGESDFKNPRPFDLDWARSIRDECQMAGVKYFHKQHGGSKKINGTWGGRELDGRTWDEFPDA